MRGFLCGIVARESNQQQLFCRTEQIGIDRKGLELMKMPKENTDISMFAPCGMNCKVCYKHCYHRKPCAGCLNSDKGKPEHCRKCKIKDCIKEKALTYCFECSEHPCKLIKNLEKSYNKRYQASLIENSCFVQKYGLDCFME